MLPYYEWLTIHIGPVVIQVWGLMVALGILCAVLILWKRGKAKGFDPEELISAALWMILLGFLFARLFHIAVYEPAYYFSHPSEILMVWHGGLSSFGGFLGAAIGFYVFLKKKKIARARVLPMLDQLSFAAIYGWMIARVGCSLTHLHWGVLCEGCPLAIAAPEGGRYDMAIIEILGLLPLAVVFFIVRNKKVADGWFLSVLLMYYGVLRFVLDFFRATDIAGADTRYFGLTPAQYFAIVMVVVGMWMWMWKKGRVA